jgi:hypothetical protein
MPLVARSAFLLGLNNAMKLMGPKNAQLAAMGASATDIAAVLRT